jgi:hypothetical protein
MTATLATQIHRQAMEASIQEIAGKLQELLTRRLTAYIAGVDTGKTVARWANGDVTEIREMATEQSLRTAYEIALVLLDRDAPETVRAWFIGLNPQLGDVSPAEALHDGQFRDALVAARAFVAGG